MLYWHYSGDRGSHVGQPFSKHCAVSLYLVFPPTFHSVQKFSYIFQFCKPSTPYCFLMCYLFINVQHVYTVVTDVLSTRTDPPNHLQKCWYLSVTAHNVASRVTITVTAPSWESRTSWPRRESDIQEIQPCPQLRYNAYFHHIIHPPFVNNTADTNPYTGKGRPFLLLEVEAPRISRQSAREGNKIVTPTHRPPLPPEDTPATHLC
jgi:hypothetical protein